jgi:hypothetical protein
LDLVEGAVEFHVKPSLYLLIYRRPSWSTSLRDDVVRMHFAPSCCSNTL